MVAKFKIKHCYTEIELHVLFILSTCSCWNPFTSSFMHFQAAVKEENFSFMRSPQHLPADFREVINIIYYVRSLRFLFQLLDLYVV